MTAGSPRQSFRISSFCRLRLPALLLYTANAGDQQKAAGSSTQDEVFNWKDTPKSGNGILPLLAILQSHLDQSENVRSPDSSRKPLHLSAFSKGIEALRKLRRAFCGVGV